MRSFLIKYQDRLATDQMVDAPRAAPSFKSLGLALPPDLLRKAYHDCARRWCRLRGTRFHKPLRGRPRHWLRRAEACKLTLHSNRAKGEQEG